MDVHIISRSVLSGISAASAIELVDEPQCTHFRGPCTTSVTHSTEADGTEDALNCLSARHAFVVGDDSVHMIKVDLATMRTTARHALLPVPEGTSGDHIAKAKKPDFECMTELPPIRTESGTHKRLAVIGSGSKSNGIRDGVVIVTFTDNACDTIGSIIPYSASPFFDKLRSDKTVTGGAKLNLEAAAVLEDGTLLLCHRGNIGDHNSIICVSAEAFERSLTNASVSATDATPTTPEYKVVRVAIPAWADDSRWHAGLSALATIKLPSVEDPSKLVTYLLFSASYEATDNEIDDGDTLGSRVGLLRASEIFEKSDATPITPQTALLKHSGEITPVKLEGITPVAVRMPMEAAARAVSIVAVGVTDPDGAPSEIITLSIELPDAMRHS